jgi:hypothetical protein
MARMRPQRVPLGIIVDRLRFNWNFAITDHSFATQVPLNECAFYMNSRVPASDENALFKKNDHATTWPLSATNTREKRPSIATLCASMILAEDEQRRPFYSGLTA